MAKDCRSKKADQDKGQSNSSKTMRPCKHCGGKHYDFKCWELPHNAKHRPANWKSRKGNEAANVAQDHQLEPRVEFLLSNVDKNMLSSRDQDMLLHPNIWIGDTAATVHMAPYEEGMINMKSMPGGITVGNGDIMETSKSGDIPCVICDKHGQSLTSGMVTEVALIRGSPFNSAATVHMTPYEEGMINMKSMPGGITVGNGDIMETSKSGDIPCVICDKHGQSLTSGMVTEVALIRGSPFNIFSLTKMMNLGWTLGGDSSKGITLTKDNNVLTFDIPIETPNGIVYAMLIRRSEIANPALHQTMSIELAHRLLGQVPWMGNQKRQYGPMSSMHDWQVKTEKYQQVQLAQN
jgi:hypothetical protein